MSTDELNLRRRSTNYAELEELKSVETGRVSAAWRQSVTDVRSRNVVWIKLRRRRRVTCKQDAREGERRNGGSILTGTLTNRDFSYKSSDRRNRRRILLFNRSWHVRSSDVLTFTVSLRKNVVFVGVLYGISASDTGCAYGTGWHETHVFCQRMAVLTAHWNNLIFQILPFWSRNFTFKF